MKKLLLLTILVGTFNFLKAQCDDTLPIFDNFDTNTVGVCWDIIDQDNDGRNWIWRQFSSFYGGGECLESRSWSSGSGDIYPDNWVYSFPIDLTSYSSGTSLKLSWKVRGQDPNQSHEFYTIYAATGNQITDFENSTVKRSEYVDEVGGAGVWVNRELDISSLAGNTIFIAFRHQNVSGSQFNINIDDVLLSSTALSLEDIEVNGFRHFYNNYTKELTLRSDLIPMKSIQLYDLLGKQVVSANISEKRESVKLASLNRGIYIATITFEGAQKAFKFVKH